MSDSVLLNVDIPANVEVGSSITVSYEDKYFEIVVPEGGPGQTIQVAIPVETLPEAQAVEVEADGTVDTSKTNSDGTTAVTSDMKKMGLAAGAGVVVGALILGPVTVGALGLGALAAYAAKDHVKNLPDEVGPDGVVRKKDDGTVFSKVAVAGATMGKAASDVNDKYKITATVAATATTVGTKIVETDQKYQISAKTNEAAKTVAAKVVETDKKYQISAKASEATSAALSKAKQLNEEHKITERATAVAGSIFSSVSGAVAKMTAPSPAESTPTTATATAAPSTR